MDVNGFLINNHMILILNCGKEIKLHELEAEYVKKVLMDSDIEKKTTYLRLSLTKTVWFFFKKETYKVIKLSDISALV